MSVPGVDYAWSKPSIAALQAAREVFVAQYFSSDSTKNLTSARATALKAAKIDIVVVWEYGAQDMRGGHAQGVHDATAAEAEAKACGVDGIPIYFACDYDAPPADQSLINAYMDGAASVLGDDRGRNFYGGYWPASRAHAAGKVKRVWGTLAWSGSNWATGKLVPDIMQGGFVNIGGVTCDLDAALSTDFGQWPRPAGPVKKWREWKTQGHSSLADVSAATGMSVSRILRVTASHYTRYDTITSAYLNDVFAGKVSPSAKIPAGASLWVLK